jgi:uncharacterized protein
VSVTTVTPRTIAGVPALLAHVGQLERKAPVVRWFHGLGVDKETHRAELEILAQEGFLAVGLDAVGHGERRWPHLQKLIDAPREEAFRTAVDIAVAGAGEVQSIVAQLAADGYADPARIALAGISMGAFTVYRALADWRGADRVVAMLGSPKWPFSSSPHGELDAFCATELLSITAEHDENVPPKNARNLHLALDQRCPDRHRYVELKGGVHLMSAEHWEHARSAMLAWLRPMVTGQAAADAEGTRVSPSLLFGR